MDRYSVDREVYMFPDLQGDYVKYADHLAEVMALKEKLNEASWDREYYRDLEVQNNIERW